MNNILRNLRLLSWKHWLVLTTGVTVLALATGWPFVAVRESHELRSLHANHLPVPAPLEASVTVSKPTREEVRAAAARRSLKHLKQADAECRQKIDDALRPLNALFDRARANTPAFAESMLGMSSKWRLAVDQVPFTRGDRHTEFVRGQVATHLFTPKELQRTLELVVREFLEDTVDAENRMLVALRLDLEDLPPDALPELANGKRLAGEFQAMLREVQSRVATSLSHDMTSLVASEVATFVATQIATRIVQQAAVRLGVQSGILGAGVASSWWTCGASVLAAIVVDWIVAKVWDWWADPRGELAGMLKSELTAMQKMVVDGEGIERGLRGELRELARKRAELRAQAIELLWKKERE